MSQRCKRGCKSKQEIHLEHFPWILTTRTAVQTMSLHPPVMEGREAPEQTSLPSWACWWRPWQWVCQAGQTAQQRWTRRWVRGPAHRQKSGRKPAEPGGSAALGPGAACCIGKLGLIKNWYFIKVLASFSSGAASLLLLLLDLMIIYIFCFICWLSSPSIIRIENFKNTHFMPMSTHQCSNLHCLFRGRNTHSCHSHTYSRWAYQNRVNDGHEQVAECYGDETSQKKPPPSCLLHQEKLKTQTTSNCSQVFVCFLSQNLWQFTVCVWHLLTRTANTITKVKTSLYSPPPEWRSHW